MLPELAMGFVTGGEVSSRPKRSMGTICDYSLTCGKAYMVAFRVLKMHYLKARQQKVSDLRQLLWVSSNFKSHKPKGHAIKVISTFKMVSKQVPSPPSAFSFSFVWGKGTKSTFPTLWSHFWKFPTSGWQCSETTGG